MLLKLRQTIDTYSMLVSGVDVLVALSGGADSVALLMALNEISDEYNINLSAIHINHNLRGEESLRDEQFCKELCNSLNIPLVVESVDVNGISLETGDSIELCARKLRYELFSKHAKGIIATAHTASDNAETMIYNLCRGSAISGIAGIPPVRDNIIRPLIDCTRDDIISYLDSINQSFVNDSSNDLDDYTRNRIRHNIIPRLLEINPSFFDASSRASVLLRQDDCYLSKISEQEFEKYYSNGVLKSDIISLDVAILSRVLSILFVMEIGIKPEFLHVVQMLSVVNGEFKRCSLPKEMQFESCKNGFCISKITKTQEFCETIFFDADNISKFFPGSKAVDYNQYKNLCNVNNLLFKFSIDCDKIKGKVVVRTRQDGDSYRPVARKVTKTLRKLLSEAKVTSEQSNSLILLCDDDGIFFSNLFGIDERVVVTNKSKNIIVLRDAEGKLW